MPSPGWKSRGRLRVECSRELLSPKACCQFGGRMPKRDSDAAVTPGGCYGTRADRQESDQKRLRRQVPMSEKYGHPKWRGSNAPVRRAELSSGCWIVRSILWAASCLVRLRQSPTVRAIASIAMLQVRQTGQGSHWSSTPTGESRAGRPFLSVKTSAGFRWSDILVYSTA